MIYEVKCSKHQEKKNTTHCFFKFYTLILVCVGGLGNIREALKGPTQQIFPMNYCLLDWNVTQFIQQTRWGVLQYCLCQVNYKKTFSKFKMESFFFFLDDFWCDNFYVRHIW